MHQKQWTDEDSAPVVSSVSVWAPSEFLLLPAEITIHKNHSWQ